MYTVFKILQTIPKKWWILLYVYYTSINSNKKKNVKGVTIWVPIIQAESEIAKTSIESALKTFLRQESLDRMVGITPVEDLPTSTSSTWSHHKVPPSALHLTGSARTQSQSDLWGISLRWWNIFLPPPWFLGESACKCASRVLAELKREPRCRQTSPSPWEITCSSQMWKRLLEFNNRHEKVIEIYFLAESKEIHKPKEFCLCPFHSQVPRFY